MLSSRIISALIGAAIYIPLAGLAYDAQTDSIAYRVTLWKDGNPSNAVNVVGKYADLSKEGIGEHPECTVQVFKEKKDSDTFWTINVKPKGDYGVYSVVYPMLYLPRLKDGYLVYPREMGQKLENVFDKNDRPFSAGSCGEQNADEKVKAVYYGRYSEYSGLIMQMLLVENTEEGVMIWTQDGEAWVKDFAVSTRVDAHKGQGLRVAVIHYPEETGQKGTGFKSPYPVVTTPYKGGWYEAAQIYRQWALKQKWCAKGKVYDRPNTPEWFKKTHFWAGGGWFYEMEKGFEQIKKYQEMAGGKDIGAFLSQWQKYYQIDTHCPDFFPPHDEPAFRRILAYQDKGIHIGPYIQGLLVTANQDFYRYLERWVARDPSGSPYHCFVKINRPELDPYQWPDIKLFKEELRKAWSGPLQEEFINSLNCFPMPPSEREKQKKLLRSRWGKDASLIDQLVFYADDQWMCPGYERVIDFFFSMAQKNLGVYKAQIQYFDTFPIPVFPCYDKTHGHPLGYGPWMAKGQLDLCARISEKFPSAIIISEGMTEYMLGSIQHYFMKDYDAGNCVPLFASVYHGYIEYSAFPVCGKDYQKGWDNAEDCASFVALAMHLGYAAGGYPHIGPSIAGMNGYDANDVRVKFIKATIETRLQYRDYLAAGRRLKDPLVQDVTPREAMGWARLGRGPMIKMNLAPIQASKWAKNGDDTKELLLISNASAEQQSAAVDGQQVELEPFSWKAIETQLKK